MLWVAQVFEYQHRWCDMIFGAHLQPPQSIPKHQQQRETKAET